MTSVERQIQEALEREQISGVLPGPLALRKERRDLPEAIDQLHDEDDVREVLQDFNRRVRDALLRESKVLVGGVNVEEYVAAWRDRRSTSDLPDVP